MGQTWPLRILLAEDHPTNQKLAQAILGRLGYRADVAGNGLEAVQAVGRQPYDVVLMDMQMPEMDGLQATHQIRQKWPGEAGPHIIAMTANVMRGDRERCIKAGMNDFVPKPIRIESLVEALRKAPLSDGRGALPGSGVGEPSHTIEEAATILDPAALETLLDVIGGDEGMLQELIDSILRDAPPLLADLRRSLAERDAAGIRRAAHTLKSSGNDFGATVMAGLCHELEEMGREGRLEGAAGYVRRVEAEYAQAKEALASVEVRGGRVVVRRNVARRDVARRPVARRNVARHPVGPYQPPPTAAAPPVSEATAAGPLEQPAPAHQPLQREQTIRATP
ncbi:MAG: response regulator, partial [bacterium]|nr:response regulator [bacterium]